MSAPPAAAGPARGPLPPAPLPEGACDCHMHFYAGASHPRLPGAPFAPPPAGPADYARVQAALGLERLVAVQSVIYGTDNSCMLEAMARFGGQARGIAVIPPAGGDLDGLHARGIRGLRAYMLAGGTYRWQDLPGLAARIAPLGWHIQLQMDGCRLPEAAALLAALPCPLVIDHVGKFLAPTRPEDPAFAALLRLLDDGRTFVKLSAPYESSRSGPPEYADVGRLARALVAHAPERCLWASNWPHTAQSPPPDDARLFGLLADWAPRAADRDRILVANPAALYGFPPPAGGPG